MMSPQSDSSTGTGSPASSHYPSYSALRNSGRRDGRNNQPPPDHQGPTAIEQAVIDASFHELRRFNYTAAERIQGLEEEYRRTARLESVPDLSTLTDETIVEVAQVKTQAKSHLTSRRREEREMLRDLNLFKRENSLNRAAIFPHSVRLHVAILLAVLIGESALNMYFFALGSEFGLLGGFLQAFIVSSVNVGLGFLFGYFLVRNAIHVKLFRKAVGVAAFLLFSSICVSVNLVAAHYRDLLEVAPDSAMRSAVSSTLDAPHDLTLNAILLTPIRNTTAW